MRSTHSGQLERWVSPEIAANLSEVSKDFPVPIAVAGVPGYVYAYKGDFIGKIRGGYYMSLAEYAHHKWQRACIKANKPYLLNAGFTSLSDLISEATGGGKSQKLLFQKSPTTATTAGNACIARNIGTLPSARGVGGTSGTGVKCTSATAGALKFANPAGGDYTHITTITCQSTAISSLLLFDCLWDMTYNHASSTSTSIDGSNRPDRYQTAALNPGTFISTEITTVLSATAHNITVTYVDQDGNTAEAAAAYAAAASAVALRANTPAGQWFVPLNAGDTGASYLTIVAQSTITSVTGTSTFFLGHPLALFPLPTANVPFIYDGINSAFNLERVYDDACLSFMTPGVVSGATITYNGIVQLVSG